MAGRSGGASQGAVAPVRCLGGSQGTVLPRREDRRKRADRRPQPTGKDTAPWKRHAAQRGSSRGRGVTPRSGRDLPGWEGAPGAPVCRPGRSRPRNGAATSRRCASTRHEAPKQGGHARRSRVGRPAGMNDDLVRASSPRPGVRRAEPFPKAGRSPAEGG